MKNNFEDYKLELKKEFSKKLYNLLATQRKSQAELSKFVKVTEATVSNWCNPNVIKFPKEDKMQLICQFFSVERSYFDAEPKEKEPTNNDRLISLLDRLTDENKKKAIEYFTFLLQQQNSNSQDQ